MNYLAIGLGCIIIAIIYYFYIYVTNNNLTAGLQPLNQQLSFTYDKLSNPSSYTYSYQLWLYVSNPVSQNTRIFYRGSSGSNPYSEFELDLNGTQLTLNASNGSDNSPKQIMSITQNFPVQKWVYLVINVFNLQTFEVYMNGKLAKTVNTSTSIVPSSKTSSLYIGDSSVTGYTTKFSRLPKTLDAKTIWNNYLSGNGLANFFTSLFPYGLNMTISSGEDITRSIRLF
jgi:hypothetical protein